MFQPLTLLDSLQEQLNGVAPQFARLNQLAKIQPLVNIFFTLFDFQLPQRFSHYMNVLNALEHELCVWIESLGFITLRMQAHGKISQQMKI